MSRALSTLVQPSSTFIFLAIFALSSHSSWADPPSWQQLFPPGGSTGSEIEVKAIGGKFSHWPPQAFILPRTGLSIQAGKSKGTFKFTLENNATEGSSLKTFWIRLFDTDGATSWRPFYASSFPQVLEKEPNNSHRQSQKLEAPTTIINGGLLKNGDVDSFSIEMLEGETLIADLSAQRQLASALDGVLQVTDDRGFVLAQNHDDATLDPRIVLKASKTGTYHVRLFAFPAQPNSSIRFSGATNYFYRLTVTKETFIDHYQPLAISNTYFQNEDRTELHLKPRGWNNPPNSWTTDLNPATTINLNYFKPRAIGARNLPLLIEPHSIQLEDSIRQSNQTATISFPSSISGSLEEEGERDIYDLKVEKGTQLKFTLLSRSLESLGDLVLTIRSPSGSLLKRQDDQRPNFDPQTSISFKESGIHKIEISDLHHRGGLRYYYLLRVTPPKPSFTLSTTTDRFTIERGKKLEIPIKIARLNGHREPITLQGLNLPEGISGKPIEAAGGKKPATEVKLVIEASTKAKSGVFNMGALNKQGKRASHWVNFPIPNLIGTENRMGPTRSLWLTVKAPPKPKAQKKTEK